MNTIIYSKYRSCCTKLWDHSTRVTTNCVLVIVSMLLLVFLVTYDVPYREGPAVDTAVSSKKKINQMNPVEIWIPAKETETKTIQESSRRNRQDLVADLGKRQRDKLNRKSKADTKNDKLDKNVEAEKQDIEVLTEAEKEERINKIGDLFRTMINKHRGDYDEVNDMEFEMVNREDHDNDKPDINRMFDKRFFDETRRHFDEDSQNVDKDNDTASFRNDAIEWDSGNGDRSEDIVSFGGDAIEWDSGNGDGSNDIVSFGDDAIEWDSGNGDGSNDIVSFGDDAIEWGAGNDGKSNDVISFRDDAIEWDSGNVDGSNDIVRFGDNPIEWDAGNDGKGNDIISFGDDAIEWDTSKNDNQNDIIRFGDSAIESAADYGDRSNANNELHDNISPIVPDNDINMNTYDINFENPIGTDDNNNIETTTASNIESSTTTMLTTIISLTKDKIKELDMVQNYQAQDILPTPVSKTDDYQNVDQNRKYNTQTELNSNDFQVIPKLPIDQLDSFILIPDNSLDTKGGKIYTDGDTQTITTGAVSEEMEYIDDTQLSTTAAYEEPTDGKVENNPNDVKVRSDLTPRGQRKLEILGRTDLLDADRKCSKKLPDVIIIGVMKAGTEAFSTFLAINPQVAMSLNVRTTLFFTSRYHMGLPWYRAQMMCSTSDQVTIEKAPQYYPNALAPGRIHKMNPNIKLIMMVRDPIDRAVSHFLQVQKAHPQEVKGKTFEQMVFTPNGQVRTDSKFIGLSRYSGILKRWLKYFSLKQILIIDGDEFKRDQIKSLSITEQFIGVKNFITKDKFAYNKDKGFYCIKTGEGGEDLSCLGGGKGRAHPPISPSNLQKLKNYFKPYNEEFYRIVNRRYKW